MKTLISVVGLAILVSSLAFGQTGQSQTNTASFLVSTAIIVTPTPGDFGELLAGQTYSIAADGSIAPDVGGVATVPSMLGWDIIGQPDASVLITFGLPTYFASDAGGAHVPYSVGPQSAGWAGTTFASGSPYNPIDPRIPNTITLTGGAATVQLGGTLAVPATANGGYTGTFVLTASYTGM